MEVGWQLWKWASFPRFVFQFHGPPFVLFSSYSFLVYVFQGVSGGTCIHSLQVVVIHQYIRYFGNISGVLLNLNGVANENLGTF